MPKPEMIRNGKFKSFLVERKKLPPGKPKEQYPHAGLLGVESHHVDGSDNNILIVRLSRNATLPEREKIETEMKQECPELFFNVCWRDNGDLKVTMKTRTNDCCCSDVLTCVKKVLRTI